MRVRIFALPLVPERMQPVREIFRPADLWHGLNVSYGIHSGKGFAVPKVQVISAGETSLLLRRAARSATLRLSALFSVAIDVETGRRLLGDERIVLRVAEALVHCPFPDLLKVGHQALRKE